MGKNGIRRQRDLLKLLETGPVLAPEVLKSVVTLLLEAVEAEAQSAAEEVTGEARDDG